MIYIIAATRQAFLYRCRELELSMPSLEAKHITRMEQLCGIMLGPDDELRLAHDSYHVKDVRDMLNRWRMLESRRDARRKSPHEKGQAQDGHARDTHRTGGE